MRLARIVLAALMVAAAAFSVAAAWGALRNLFAGYRDSEVWTYLLYGGFWLVIAAALLAGATRVVRRDEG